MKKPVGFLLVSCLLWSCASTQPVQPATKIERKVIAHIGGLLFDVDGAHAEVKAIKKLLKPYDCVAQYQGSLQWLIWVNETKQTDARMTLKDALGKGKFKYLYIRGLGLTHPYLIAAAKRWRTNRNPTDLGRPGSAEKRNTRERKRAES